MNILHDLIVMDYSLVISIGATVISLLVAIAGVACSKKEATIAGVLSLIVFLILCVVVLAVKYFSGMPEGSEVSSKPTAMPESVATPEPAITPGSVATPEPAITPGSAATPEPAITPEPVATPEPAITPGPVATPEPVITPEPTAVPDYELVLDIAPIEASVYNVSPIDSSDSSISPVEITTFSGIISLLQQKDNYSFVAEIEGTYRFEFSDVPSGTYYGLYVYNSGNECIKYNRDLDNGDGVTVSLEAGQSYDICVEQYKNIGAYTLNVGPQKPVVDVSQLTAVNDSIQYTAQENNYLFIAPRDGLYRFDFSNVPEGTDLALYVYNAGWEPIGYARDLDNGDGINVELSEGQAYYIRAAQYRGVGDYTLNIGHKKEIVDISAYTAVTDSMQYTGQENDYAFVPSVSGTYRFEFSDVPDGTDLSLYIYNAGWEPIKYARDLDSGDGISAELSAGKTYYVKAVQYRSVGSYVLNVGHKKEIVDISAYTAVTDSIQYTGQENDYAFVPSVSGTYPFQFSDVPDGTDLSLYIYNAGWEPIKYTRDLDSGDCVSVELSAGMTYYIRVTQYRKYGTYKLRF